MSSREGMAWCLAVVVLCVLVLLLLRMMAHDAYLPVAAADAIFSLGGVMLLIVFMIGAQLVSENTLDTSGDTL